MLGAACFAADAICGTAILSSGLIWRVLGEIWTAARFLSLWAGQLRLDRARGAAREVFFSKCRFL
jgi:hypothetical protein